MIFACSSSHESPKTTTPIAPVEQSWVIDKAHETLQSLPVSNPKPLEARVETLENEMAKLKLNLAQIDQRYGLKPVHTTNKPKPITAPKTITKYISKKTGVRFGVNSGKTRIVIDLPRAMKFTTDLDNNEKFLLIELQDTDLSLNAGTGQGLVSTYSIDTDTDGVTRVVLNLKGVAQIITKEALRPAGSAGHRVFIDLVRN
ncbi:MAG: AMIN domain-containing protein [Alphaproteobacteria bacterium]|nr:AMIN domain-containing protein [Alphaproteobacteria bacterium]